MSIDKYGGVIADTVYIGNELVAENVQIDLP